MKWMATMLGTILIGMTVGPVAVSGGDAPPWLKTHRLLGRACGMGTRAERPVCKKYGEVLLDEGAPGETIAVEACRTLSLPKSRLLCVEEFLDHWGPSPLDPVWRRCHREHARLPEMRACLLREIFGEEGEQGEQADPAPA